jgi:hypothetical protein
MQCLSAKHRFSVRRRQEQGAEVVVVAVARQQSSSNPRDWYTSPVGPGLDKEERELGSRDRGVSRLKAGMGIAQAIN